ncbi:DUF2158 domain-containing protein [Bradyrhizobium sp. U87765 SZCCT0131]|uniref:DUF2158 domain-containing protein n=1 Tax=unclassified Bradyrhizobium TaxID=2631580 RepID=UPI001BA6CCC6|nr:MULTISPECIES: DUF2158 domain-containing protein [unclassified Bradyrhizobium]MBR1221214.1 DUF2158 domain-containing protein [Bradyrhizobium sp. U87765 SZCCT0131]MBR1259965.1 DUF2158 domain-containing protein [Bradyrhizobium sp. U87765 SZCCT0134]MBR1307786.1 DUF2158 domain-containing protein [Bradyrhizobium sp. U87765 SZCCT0110]MBR1321740.1 DUF2158 domain-containing protein [Bradyrhizobium sp. U87765 SZCCT0109]MBR1350052.1 DUF2158 domain-containing protein [Bradyrhizobium sp. U87765 SZCCT004
MVRHKEMARLKEGDLVVLRSGGPVMTVDAVNTSVFDDSKVTGVSCVWFVGDAFHRVRFDPNAVERVKAKHTAVRRVKDASGAAPQYTSTLDTVIGAMNDITEATKPVASSSANGMSAPATPKRPSSRTTAKMAAPKIVTS